MIISLNMYFAHLQTKWDIQTENVGCTNLEIKLHFFFIRATEYTVNY